MKNKLFSLIILVNMLLMAFSLFSCGGHTHVFDQKVMSAKYREKAGTCTTPSTYFYSCVCGEKGTEKFEGPKKDHSYILHVEGDYKSDYKLGETFDPTGLEVSKVCLNCNDTVIIDDYEIDPSGVIPANSNFVTIKSGDLSCNVDIRLNLTEITEVTLETIDNKVYYTISGHCLEGADSSTLYLELISRYQDFVYFGKEDSDLQIENVDGINNFKLMMDVTSLPANTSWFFPMLHIDGTTSDLYDESCQWNNKGNVTIGNSTYKILHTKNTGYRPLVTRIFAGSIPENASYVPEEADLIEENNRAYLIIKGTQEGYTYETLSSVLKFELKKTGAVKYLEYNKSLNSTLKLIIEENTFSLKCDVTDLDINGNPYFTHFVYFGTTQFKDLNTLEVDKVNVGQSFTLNNITYELVYDPINGKGDPKLAYGTVGLRISDK